MFEYEKQEIVNEVNKQIEDCKKRLDKRFDSIEEKLNKIIDNNSGTYTPIEVPFYNYPWSVDTPDPCKNCPQHPSNGGSGICHCTLGQNISYKAT